MARLVSFDLGRGQRIRMNGKIYQVLHSDTGATGVTMQAEGSAEELHLSRSALATAIVLEEAEFIDELEDPDIKLASHTTNISFLRTHRIYDRYLMMILINGVLAMKQSPKSANFRNAFRDAEAILEAYREHSIIAGGKRWSMWTIYHLLLRWRSSGHAFAAFHLKGVMNHPWRKKDPRYLEARELVEQLALAHPKRPIAWIHGEVDRLLKKKYYPATSPGEVHD